MTGWIKLHRELLESSLWVNSTAEQRTILITLLCTVNFEPNKWEFDGQIYELQAGQCVTSIASIVEKCKCKDVTTQKVRTALKRFEKLGFLTSKATNRNRLLTIVNWRKYQEINDEANKADNKQITSSQQADNKQITSR